MKKRKSPNEKNSDGTEDSIIHLTVENTYQLPTFYDTATPKQVGIALELGAKEMTSESMESRIASAVKEAVEETKRECMSLREAQQVKNEERFASLLQRQTSVEEEYKAALGKVKQQHAEEKGELDKKIAALVRECDEYDETVRQLTENINSQEGESTLTQFFTSTASYSSELSQLYAKHQSLIKELNVSMATIRAKEYLFYKSAKECNDTLPNSQDHMTVPHESSVDFCLSKMLSGKSWNDIRHSARDEVEAGIGKDAFLLLLAQEKSKSHNGEKTADLRTWLAAK